MQDFFIFGGLDLLFLFCYNYLRATKGAIMDKISFYESYNLSDATPRSPELEIIYSDGFAAALEEFINDRFRGIAHVSHGELSSSAILCSTEYAAYLFKTLLAEIYGRVFLDIRISTDDRGLTILINHNDPLPLTEGEMRNIIRIARNAGMEIYPSEGSIRLTMSFADAALRRIYAANPRDSRGVMLYKLGEIFHCGAISHTVKNKKEAVK